LPRMCNVQHETDLRCSDLLSKVSRPESSPVLIGEGQTVLNTFRRCC